RRAGWLWALRIGFLHRVPTIDIRSVVVLDELSDLLRDPRRHSHGGFFGDVCRCLQAGSGSPRIAPLGSVWRELPLSILDSRRAGLRLCHVGDPSAAVSLV